MKKRILFVDDEPMVLQGLERLLRSKRNEWEMDFVDSGQKALVTLGKQEYSLIVSDMLMPGMNGVELLTRVKEQFPKCLRLILSGHAELQLVMKCVGVAHQYLAKPCDSETLKRAIERVTAPGFVVQNERVLTVVSRTDRLPSVPTLYLKINGLLQDPEVSADAVGTVIAKDIGMTAKILKIVNSAFFGLRRPVSDPVEAVSYLGVDILKSLVLSLHVFSQFEKIGAPDFSVERLWNHSLLVAGLSKLIMQLENAIPDTVKEAFSVGMLHDAGKLILVSNFPNQMAEVARIAVQRGVSMHEAERDVFGSSHAEVGGYLLGLWGLPASVVDAVTFHHFPDVAEPKEFGVLTAVHVADCIANRLLPSPSGTSPSVNEGYLKELELAERLPIWEEAAQNSSMSEAA